MLFESNMKVCYSSLKVHFLQGILQRRSDRPGGAHWGQQIQSPVASSVWHLKPTGQTTFLEQTGRGSEGKATTAATRQKKMIAMIERMIKKENCSIMINIYINTPYNRINYPD